MNKFIVLVSIWICILIGGFTAIVINEDTTGPTITVNSDTIVYSEGEDEDTLLAYVTAIDDRDGDVTDSIMVADILPLLDKTAAKVVYVAEDKNNNVTKKEVRVNYAPLSEENGLDSQENNITDSNQGNNQAITQGTQNTRGTENSQTNNQSDSTEANQSGSNTQGQQTATSEQLEDEENTSSETPILTLSDTQHTISRRESFEPKDMIKSVSDDKDMVNYLMEHITIVGQYDIYTRGEYVLQYSVTDSDGNASELQYMVLTVE